MTGYGINDKEDGGDVTGDNELERHECLGGKIRDSFMGFLNLN